MRKWLVKRLTRKMDSGQLVGEFVLIREEDYKALRRGADAASRLWKRLGVCRFGAEKASTKIMLLFELSDLRERGSEMGWEFTERNEEHPPIMGRVILNAEQYARLDKPDKLGITIEEV